MPIKRIFLSSPADANLDGRGRSIKHAILRKLSQNGYSSEEFLSSGLAARMGWSFNAIDNVIRHCHGAINLALPRWTTDDGHSFASEYNHYEGAVANTRGVPMLIVADEAVARRGIVYEGGGQAITYIPRNADALWLESEDFSLAFGRWRQDVDATKDVFLGYCGKAKSTAQMIHLYLSKLGISVIDWSTDFQAGGTVLEEISRAATLCSCGIFLFTRDDALDGDEHHAAPRDNVVFEAGYYIAAKGKERTLIIREDGAKIPADIGGNIYLLLKDRTDTSTIETQLRRFVEART